MHSHHHRSLPHSLYTAAQVRELDRIAIEEQGIPGIELMERAGRAAFDALRRRWPRLRSIAVLCGTGNNGGDGFVVARLARQAGYELAVYQVGDAGRIRGDALTARRRMQEAGVEAQPLTDDVARQPVELWVDALLGTGLSGEVGGPWAQAIDTLNAARALGAGVLALDIPSGLHADTGAVMGCAVRADLCVTFIGVKQGLLTGQGVDCCAELSFDDLAVPAAVFERVPAAASRLTCPDPATALGPRRRAAHKGDYGHVLVVGGDHGMMGAARLAGEAAARVGAGLVSIGTRAEHATAIAGARPELMARGVDGAPGLAPLLARATVVAAGPGLGQGHWGRQMLAALLQARLPLVMDADALNLLAAEPVRRDDWVLTPHPAEAARLLGVAVADVEANRPGAASEIQQRYGGVAVLKGAGSIVVDGVETGICSDGNPGMASGGMGDVLTGVIAGLLAQGLPAPRATRLGVCLHAAAGDRAAQAGQRGLLASDLFPVLRELMG